MELVLTRKTFTNNSTIGQLTCEDWPSESKGICKILEDVDRRLEVNPGKKVHGRSAIPRGRYQIVVTMSNRFGKELPLLLNVPGFEGIRIHPGNSSKDTEGCLLPGVSSSLDFVGQSRSAFDVVNKLIHLALNRGEKVWITVE